MSDDLATRLTQLIGCYFMARHSGTRVINIDVALDNLQVVRGDDLDTRTPLENLSPEPVLCYIERCSSIGLAYFTSRLEDQWGDDWNDRPYEHNAGPPYEWDQSSKTMPYAVHRLAFESPHHETPAEAAGGNSRYSVEDINRGCVAWLAPSPWGRSAAAPIYAGASAWLFRRIIMASGGMVYLPESE